MTYTTNSFERMMRFPIIPIHIEQNHKLRSENAWDDVFDNISRVELDRKQVAVSQHRIILYGSSKRLLLRSLRMNRMKIILLKLWIIALPHNELVTSCRNFFFISTFKYRCNVASAKYNFQNKVITTTTTAATSIFPDIGKGEKRSEN
jgi:hypothetical protein